MANESGARQPLSISPPHLTLLVVCVVAVYFVVGFYGKSLDSFRMNRRVAEVRQEMAQLEAENRTLQERIAYLQADAYIETAAREKLNLARPGDRSVVVIQAQPADLGPPGPPPGGPAATSSRHFEEWLDLFFGQR